MYKTQTWSSRSSPSKVETSINVSRNSATSHHLHYYHPVHPTSISCLGDCNNLPTVLPTSLLPPPDYSQYSSRHDHFKSDYVTSLLMTLLKVSRLIWDKTQGFIMTQRPWANICHHHALPFSLSLSPNSLPCLLTPAIMAPSLFPEHRWQVSVSKPLHLLFPQLFPAIPFPPLYVLDWFPQPVQAFFSHITFPPRSSRSSMTTLFKIATLSPPPFLSPDLLVLHFLSPSDILYI